MARNRPKLKRNIPDVPEAAMYFFWTGERPHRDKFPNSPRFMWNIKGQLAEYWQIAKDDIMRRWLKEKPPFTRPRGWYLYEPLPEIRSKDEPELDFLKRHDLLTAREKRLIEQ